MKRQPSVSSKTPSQPLLNIDIATSQSENTNALCTHVILLHKHACYLNMERSGNKPHTSQINPLQNTYMAHIGMTMRLAHIWEGREVGQVEARRLQAIEVYAGEGMPKEPREVPILTNRLLE
jgi:hypothetical protein